MPYVVLMPAANPTAPESLPTTTITFEMDYLAQSGWWIAQVIDPSDWVWQGRADTAEQACDKAHQAAIKQFATRDICSNYRYTDNGIQQARIEDANDPAFLECEICNP